MKDIILEVLKDTSYNNPMSRKSLVKEVSSITKTSERQIRKIIAEELPDIGEAGRGYFLKRCESDFDIHDRYLMSRNSAVFRRLERNKQRRLDRQHEPCFGFVRNYADIEVPSFLKQEVL